MDINQKFVKLYQICKQAVEATGSTWNASPSWVAGCFKELSNYSRWKRQIRENSDSIVPNELENIKNKVAVLDVAAKYGIIKQSPSGAWKPTNTSQKFTQFLYNEIPKNMESNVLDKNIVPNNETYKKIRNFIQSEAGKQHAIWFNNLPPHIQYIVDVYSKLNMFDLSWLAHIKDTSDSKQKYSDKIQDLKYNREEIYSLLKDLNFINANDTINKKFITSFFQTIHDLSKHDYAHFHDFNRTIESNAARRAADYYLRYNEVLRKDGQKLNPIYGKHMDRQDQRSDILQGRKEHLNKDLSRTKFIKNQEESFKLSFKQYLTENFN